MERKENQRPRTFSAEGGEGDAEADEDDAEPALEADFFVEEETGAESANDVAEGGGGDGEADRLAREKGEKGEEGEGHEGDAEPEEGLAESAGKDTRPVAGMGEVFRAADAFHGAGKREVAGCSGEDDDGEEDGGGHDWMG